MTQKFRSYHIDYNNPDEAARATVQMHKDTLVSFRGTTPHPEELEWEIRLYDYILEDPLVRLKQYQDARFDKDCIPINKRKAVAKLGWTIP
jgi:hypothetical protein